MQLILLESIENSLEKRATKAADWLTSWLATRDRWGGQEFMAFAKASLQCKFLPDRPGQEGAGDTRKL